MEKRKFRIARSLFYFTGALVLLTQQAFAYVDPATTSYIVQIVAGIVIACGTGLGIFWNRMRRKVKNKKKDEAAPEEIRTQTESRGGVMTAEDLLDDDDTDNENK